MGRRRLVLPARNRRLGSTGVTAREDKSDGAFIYTCLLLVCGWSPTSAVKDFMFMRRRRTPYCSLVEKYSSRPPVANTERSLRMEPRPREKSFTCSEKKSNSCARRVDEENDLKVAGRRGDTSS